MKRDEAASGQPGITLDQLGVSLPPGRWEELQPRLAALLADFDELKALETDELEPLPPFAVMPEDADDWR